MDFAPSPLLPGQSGRRARVGGKSESFSNVANDHLPRLSDTRREFIKTASALTGVAVLCPCSVECAVDQPPVINVRGHHLFDMLDALGTGKSSHKTLGPVAQKVRSNPKVPVKVVVGVDDICGPCEWWDHTKGICTKGLQTYPRDNENSITSDKNAIRVLGMKEGDTMRAGELYRLIQSKVTKKVFAKDVCVACRLVNKCKETYESKIEEAVKALS